MATPIVRRNTNQSNRSKEPETSNLLPLATRRLAAWAVEITLVVASGLVPFGMGVYANSRSDLNRVPLNPVLVVTERAIAQPLALPVSYGIRNVASPTNILWTVALLAPLSLSWWQLYLLAKTGSTAPKSWFGVRVVTEEGKAPGLGSVLVREGIGRGAIPLSAAYLLWRYSFAFPNLGLFIFLTVVMVLGEGMGWPTQRRRRALHDLLAGTYTIDATRPFPPTPSANNKRGKSTLGNGDDQLHEGNEEVGRTMGTPAATKTRPSLTLVVVALVSMTGVLSALVGTQIYIQTQEQARKSQVINSQQFLTLIKYFAPNSGATNEERQNAILALGGLNDPQAIQFLVDLLGKETDPNLLVNIQQALANVGTKAIPVLKRLNQFLAGELVSVRDAQVREIREKRLNINQQTINKILAVYTGKIKDVDLGNTQLGNNGSGETTSFNLILDKVDLSGVVFKGANLNQASFQGSRFRGVGEDGRWDTYDDAIANLSQAQMRQANLTDANLSRVLMTGIDLSRATLNRANLFNARLFDAKLNSTQLVGTDLRGAVLENASLTGADISDAKLNEANLYAAHLGRVTAIATHLSNANLTKTDWQGADLSEAYLDHANLSDANLSAARLTSAILRSANLENANLRNADLSRADLQGANVAGADFQGTILFPPKQDPADQFVQTPDLGSQSALIQGVDFSQAKHLDPKQLAFICTQGGIHRRCP
ncbi:pentapeptide repeat-containing protein [Cylindrospermum sp. FACHB-282]|uniref:pentapeptide repeat-containing protein n=1 Tax=Cylindrospermum sp. FACHB-282 TaxID=2692794 RepID=UPI001688BE19|nr:pentapeptide repeat-containing protein [Cylindrospermum sp. FACHB-282]MBD2386971.1 pentapeptide repeat-containing protein [Cylindrospermum sp. FACHB-282]